MNQATDTLSVSEPTKVTSSDLNEDGALGTLIRTEQLRLLHKGSLRLFIIVLLCSTVFFGLFWDDALLTAALLYVVGFGAFGGVRILLSKTFLQSEISLPKRQKLWLRMFNFSNLAGGLLLAGSTYAFFSISEPWHVVTIFTVMMIAVFSCAIFYSTYLPAFFFFSTPLVLGMSIWLWSTGSTALQGWAIAGPILLLAVSYPAYFIHQMSLSALSRQLMNRSLSQRLSNENRKTEAARQELEDARLNLEKIVANRTRELTLTNDRLSEEIGQREKASEALQESEQRLTRVLSASRLGFWDWNMESEQIYHSRFEELFGYNIEQLDGFKGHLEHMIHTDDVTKVRRAIKSHLRGKTEQYIARYRIRHALGHWVWVEDRGQVVEWDHRKRAVRMLGTRRDISLEMKYEQEAQLAVTVFENTSDGIFVLDKKFRFMTVNQAMRDLTGYKDKDIIGKSTLELHPNHGRERYFSMLQELSESGHAESELVDYKKNGQPFPIWLQIKAVKDKAGKILHYVGLFRDLTQHKETQERLQYLSNYDPLTGLTNRTLLQSRLHDALIQAEQDHSDVALVMIDLDRFRQINDTLGHSTGDELLKQVSRRLLRHTARMNTTARLGSDEFALVIDNWTEPEILEELSKEIISTLSTPYVIGDHELLVGVSIGISRYPENAREMQSLISQADLAMNQAKTLGGNTVQLFNSSLSTTSKERLALESSLRQAISGDQLEVYYQPKMSLNEESITTAEALIRWNHPEQGLIMPGSFIGIAEETGLINEIGDFVLEEACRQTSSWLSRGWEIRISVNVAAGQLRRGNLADQISELLDKHNIPAHLLELEITESQVMEDIDQAIELLSRIRDLGVTLSIDDFGTGYSSLSYLKRLPVNSLKIDRSFISHIDQNDNDSAITKAIIAMAHSLDLTVIAEGVETQDHIQFLSQHDCDEVQGYFISRPLPVSEFNEFIETKLKAG
ncbi:EAL domain-containing protein [Parendozoicomonas haliclonae]|uniref:cyclic-guanylate-specific phosphodiesterase n=1 Tax=Parendozoicomonas haliclonae TaxID=1960125 RepID=A0A1X7AK53_9GAMM|nr:EAL domain-containing protein [Parendozoicomonas haliclonae]SMA46729.1 Cyclic di-GMP phosphodiesterase Gmr [Parendozoicomonas haliclonae]